MPMRAPILLQTRDREYVSSLAVGSVDDDNWNIVCSSGGVDTYGNGFFLILSIYYMRKSFSFAPFQNQNYQLFETPFFWAV